MTRRGRLGVGIVGAGKVGPVLGAALAGAGHAITGITSGSDDDRVAGVLPDVPVLDATEVLRRSELVIVAVPHEELPGLVAGLAVLGAWQPGQLVVHTDPGFGIGVLEPARSAGAIPIALHPAISFTGTSLDLKQLQASYTAVTAPTAVVPIGQALAVEMGSEPIVVDEEDRPAYAEAIATAASFSQAIIAQSTSLLRDIGIENPGGYLSALVQSTVERALREASPPRDIGDL